MEDKIQVKLLEDIASGNKKLYAKKGDVLFLVNVLSNILIVENELGNKFSVKVEMTDYK